MNANIIEFPFQQIAATREEQYSKDAYKKALASFEKRLGMSYSDVATSAEAQKIARRNLLFGFGDHATLYPVQG